MKTNQPKSMHCEWGMMRDETNWDKTDGVTELRGRLDKIREGFEAATEAIITHERTLAVLRYASAAQRVARETEFAAIDEAIATHRAAVPVDPDHGPIGNNEAEKNYEIEMLRAEVRRLAKENQTLKIKLSRMCCDA